jgi:hypothetical protein
MISDSFASGALHGKLRKAIGLLVSGTEALHFASEFSVPVPEIVYNTKSLKACSLGIERSRFRGS